MAMSIWFPPSKSYFWDKKKSSLEGYQGIISYIDIWPCIVVEDIKEKMDGKRN